MCNSRKANQVNGISVSSKKRLQFRLFSAVAGITFRKSIIYE